MRPRTPILAMIAALVLGLVSPWQAAAVWTSVDGLYYLQVNRVCRDGLVADIGASTSPGDYTLYVSDDSGSSPAPHAFYSTTITQSGTVTITRSGTGVYDVFLPYQRIGYTGRTGNSWDGGNVQVTAYGTSAARCQAGFWRNSAGQEPDGRYARVYCFTSAGAPADRMFTMQYTAQLQ